MGELDAGAENLRETVELRLARCRKLDAGVLDFLDGGEEVVDVADELVGAREMFIRIFRSFVAISPAKKSFRAIML